MKDNYQYENINETFPIPHELKNDELYSEQIGLRLQSMGLLPADYDLTLLPSKDDE